MPQAHKKIKKYNMGMKLLFPNEMYNNTWGSIVICSYMLAEQPIEPGKIEKIKDLWRKAEKNPDLINWDIADKDFIDKTLNFFGMERPENFPIAFIYYSEGAYKNCLFAPYIDGELLPLREDGIYTRTLVRGKIYPIDFNKEENYVEIISQ